MIINITGNPVLCIYALTSTNSQCNLTNNTMLIMVKGFKQAKCPL